MSDLTEEQRFRLGFLGEAHDRGVPAHVALAAVASLAPQAKTAGVADALTRLVGTASGPGILLALGAPVAAGGALGLGASVLTDADERDIGDLKQREYIDKLREQRRLLYNSLSRYGKRT